MTDHIAITANILTNEFASVYFRKQFLRPGVLAAWLRRLEGSLPLPFFIFAAITMGDTRSPFVEVKRQVTSPYSIKHDGFEPSKIGISGYLDIGISGYRAIGMSGYPDIGIWNSLISD